MVKFDKLSLKLGTTLSFYKKNVYKKMALKNLKILRIC